MGCPGAPKMGEVGHTLAESSALCTLRGHGEGLPRAAVLRTLPVRLCGGTTVLWHALALGN